MRSLVTKQTMGVILSSRLGNAYGGAPLSTLMLPTCRARTAFCKSIWTHALPLKPGQPHVTDTVMQPSYRFLFRSSFERAETPFLPRVSHRLLDNPP